MTYDPLAWLDSQLQQLADTHLLRSATTRTGAQGSSVDIDGRRLINFGANDYLGLASDPRLAAAAQRSIIAEGWGSGASPLITGRSGSQTELERGLAAFEQTEAALVFPSGFAANVGAITSLADRADAIFSDAENHASLVDGCRLSRATVHVYRHADLTHLQQLLAHAAGFRRRLIVTDTLFSMSGDMAPLIELVELAARFEAMLVVDEAHATGVFGRCGRGVCEMHGVEQVVPVRIGTLSKALGSHGGFVAGSQRLIDWLFNRARTQVFSTALPAACHRATLAALQIVRDEPQRRSKLLSDAQQLRTALLSMGWSLGGSVSQIVPIVIGPPEQTMWLAERLREQGLLVPGIRPPTVAQGQSRLRISLSFAHRATDRDQLLSALRQLRHGGPFSRGCDRER